MNLKNCFKNFTILTLILFLSSGFSLAQTNKLSEPRQEKLLNGLKVLTFSEPNADKVTLKLRIHSGSAFDPQNKEGTMALLGDILFPSEAAKDFFTEDLGGSLEVESTYDYIQITATSNSDKFLTMLETIANAVSKLQIDKETTAKVISARLEKVKEQEKNPSFVADLAAAKRLYGDFPYGRATIGTSESLQKIDYADLIFARQKFLTSDNATLVVIGNVKPDFVNRAARRYFGAWEKSDKKVPATFAQPETPDSKEFSIEMPNVEDDLRRYAIMTPARNDKDFYAAKILTEIWRNQFCYNDESKLGKSSFEPHLLRGTYMISSVISSKELPLMTRNPCALLLQKDGKTVYPPISQNDFDSAKSKVAADLNQKAFSINDSTDLWLDVDTYKLGSVKDEIKKASNVTFEDVQRVSENLQKQAFVNVIVKKSGELKQ
ncbi:MAG: pitrilysin family protein [Acidobacteriota bacterium]